MNVEQSEQLQDLFVAARQTARRVAHATPDGLDKAIRNDDAAASAFYAALRNVTDYGSPAAGPGELVTYHEISRATGIPAGTLRQWSNRGKLPEPDFRIGQSPAWYRTTFDAWNASRD